MLDRWRIQQASLWPRRTTFLSLITATTESCQLTDQRVVYKNWLCRLTVGYKNHVVCVWMSHEVDFMSVNTADNIECWSLMVLDCDSFSACCFTVRMRLICLQNSSRRHSAVDYAQSMHKNSYRDSLKASVDHLIVGWLITVSIVRVTNITTKLCRFRWWTESVGWQWNTISTWSVSGWIFRDWLYVGENGGQHRVLVFDGVPL